MRRIIPGERIPQGVLDNTSRSIRALATAPQYPLGAPTQTVLGTQCYPKLGQMVRLDTRSNDVTVYLPAIDASDIGQSITITEIAGGEGTVTVVPTLANINDGTPYTLTYGYFKRTLTAVSPIQWNDDFRANLLAAGAQPFFEWNETDLTQFDTPIVQSGISMTPTVVTQNGLNWIDMAVIYNAASVPPASGLIALLSITDTPPDANYMISADVIVPQVLGDGRSYPVVCVRGDYSVITKTYYQLQWRTQGTVELYIQQIGGTASVWQGQVYSSALSILGNNEGLTMRLSAEGNTLLRAAPTVLGHSWMYRDLGTPITAVGKAAFGISQSFQTLGSFTRHYLWRNIRLYRMNSANFPVTVV